MLCGEEVHPYSIELSLSIVYEILHFKPADIKQEKGAHFDLILLMDVLEHLEDYFTFWREIQPKSEYKIIHIPLDISARTVFWGDLIKFRAAYEHIHYFIKDLAIQMLKDVGYEVVDYLYTWQTCI